METSLLIFQDLEANFLHYMLKYGKIAMKTSHDYVSRMRFLSQYYMLDENITDDYVNYVMNEEKKVYTQRNRYNTVKALGDLQAALRKFLAFIKSGYNQRINDTIISEINKVENNKQLTSTERTQVIQSRIGQGLFRNKLIEYWKGCSVSGCSLLPLLVASHIRPWYVCDNDQRLDMYNGLLLQPNLDKLFDRGYITFDIHGKIHCSRMIGLNDKKLLGINDNMHLLKLDNMHEMYLKYHQENCYIG